MKLLMYLVILSALLLSCHPEKNKLVEEEDLRFQMTDASELFFKNIRKSSYSQESRKEAGMDLYTREVFEAQSLPVKPVIIINWRTDMAYFYMEKNYSKDTLRFLIRSEPARELPYTGNSQKEGAVLAMHIYNALLSGEEVYYLDDDNKQRFFKTPEQEQAFRIMFFDFLRLVEIR